MKKTKADVRADFKRIRSLMREWEQVLRATPDDTELLEEIANDLQSCAGTPLAFLEARGIQV